MDASRCATPASGRDDEGDAAEQMGASPVTAGLGGFVVETRLITRVRAWAGLGNLVGGVALGVIDGDRQSPQYEGARWETSAADRAGDPQLGHKTRCLLPNSATQFANGLALESSRKDESPATAGDS
jgi:hypothetical protein